jgi:ketosteroid isomerase-like protein
MRQVRSTMSVILGLAVVMGAIALAGARPAAADSSSKARAAIEAKNAEFMKLASGKNAAGIAALYTDDARVMPPNSPPVEGRAAIEKFFGAIMGEIGRVKIDTVELEAHGTTAHEVEALQFFDAGGKQIDEGKAIVIWKKVGGQWKLHRDMFSSNRPPAGGGS